MPVPLKLRPNGAMQIYYYYYYVAMFLLLTTHWIWYWCCRV